MHDYHRQHHALHHVSQRVGDHLRDGHRRADSIGGREHYGMEHGAQELQREHRECQVIQAHAVRRKMDQLPQVRSRQASIRHRLHQTLVRTPWMAAESAQQPTWAAASHCKTRWWILKSVTGTTRSLGFSTRSCGGQLAEGTSRIHRLCVHICVVILFLLLILFLVNRTHRERVPRSPDACPSASRSASVSSSASLTTLLTRRLRQP
mmetsp:Transcript_26155/g.84161  ORF Transcript_26155/g.84161 Transcript_26155/m.84161 type:complete len:207 (-) Transcript_26155:1793-2413(-)